MRKSLLLYGFLFCCTTLLGQKDDFQIWSLNSPLSEGSEKQQELEAPVYLNDWKEVIEERTLTSALFKNSKGDVRAEYANRPIHYYQNGTLARINPKLKESSSGFIADQQPFPTYLYTDGSFSMSIGNESKLKLGQTAVFNDEHATINFELQNNIAYFENYFNGIDKQIVFSENKVKYAYRINESINSSGINTVISESIEFPSGYELKPLKDQSSVRGDVIYGTLVLLDSKGSRVALIRPLLCFDAQKEYVLGGYKIHEQNGHLTLDLCISNSWLNDTERAYPVFIDPEIGGPPSEWTGGDMPSCLLPSFNSDSIMVTIPSGISVTGFYITGSFYANPFSPAVMSDGVMYFSTSCANSQNFTITGVNANLPGTAYLDSFNLKLPLSCCFPESCNDTSVYVTMHIARGDHGLGCNTNYVLYDDITDWPFRAVVYGKTPEAYGNEFYVSQASICSNICTFNATGYARYGVAPYTFTHPWTTEIVTDGENIGCSAGSTNHLFTLTIPDCPIYCDESYTSLDIPPPVITDACGQNVLNIPSNSKPIDPAPNVDTDYEQVYCSGEIIDIGLSSCIDGGVVHHYGNGLNGYGSISLLTENNSQSSLPQTYYSYATLGGCISDTTEINIEIVPNPQAQFNLNSNPLIVNLNLEASDLSSPFVNPINSWNWTVDGSNVSTDSVFTSSFDTPGTYQICLKVSDIKGCVDSICEVLLVVPAEIENINIITPNDDGINDELAFQYLEFYPNNEIFIFNRWGNLIYNAKSYDNTWSGENYTEGTYFYILMIAEFEKAYSSFFQLKK